MHRSHSSPAVNSLAVAGSSGRDRSPSPTDRKGKKKEKEKKKKTKKEKEKKTPFALWSQSGKRHLSVEVSSAVTINPPSDESDGGRQKSHSMNAFDLNNTESMYTEIPPSTNGIATKSASPPPMLQPAASRVVSTMTRMQERPMGLGLSGDKPQKKPKPSADGNQRHLSRLDKPAKLPKPKVTRSKSACASSGRRISEPTTSQPAPTFVRPVLTRQSEC